MNTNNTEPWLQKELLQHIQLLLYSFHHWTGNNLIPITNYQSPVEIANLLGSIV